MLNFISPKNCTLSSFVDRICVHLFFILKPLFSLAIKAIFPLLIALALSNCAVAPSTIVQTPTTAKPSNISATQTGAGAIYHVAGYRPLFEDRRARMVGDIITISITESTNASKDGSSSASKTGSVSASIGAYMGKAYPKGTFASKTDLSYKDDAAENASNKFNGSITATVTEVLANGNLMVSGEKQVAFDKGTEFVRFSGVVNPDTITLGNNVVSSKVADARIEYRTNSKIDAAQVLSILTRFFLSFGPL